MGLSLGFRIGTGNGDAHGSPRRMLTGLVIGMGMHWHRAGHSGEYVVGHGVGLET